MFAPAEPSRYDDPRCIRESLSGSLVGTVAMTKLIDLSHTVEDGMVTLQRTTGADCVRLPEPR